MLLANLDTSEGLVNGARGRIIGLSPPIVSPYDPVPRAYPVVRFENGITHTIEPKAYECSYEGSKVRGNARGGTLASRSFPPFTPLLPLRSRGLL
jgi:hypothetical protein